MNLMNKMYTLCSRDTMYCMYNTYTVYTIYTTYAMHSMNTIHYAYYIYCIPCTVCLLFHVLAASKVISGRVPTCDNAYSPTADL